MAVKTEVSVVIGSFNRRPFLAAAIDSVRRELAHCAFSSEIIVVDGGSTDGSTKWLLTQKDILTIVQHNHGEWQGRKVMRRHWGHFMNLGFRCAQGKYICMLSDDCLVVPGSILHGYELAERTRAEGGKLGGVAFYWRNWPEQKKYFIFRFYGILNVNHGLYFREALADVDYAEEDLYRFYYGDIDIVFKMDQAGYSIIASPSSFIEHNMHIDKAGRVENFQFDDEDGKTFVAKWQKVHGPARFSPENRVETDSIEFIDPAQTARAFANPSPFHRMLNRLKR